MATWLVQVAVLSTFVSLNQGKRDPVLYCSACKAMVDELSYSVSLVDPQRTLDVGGFTLKPDGSSTHRKVPLARSESHLSELLESVCLSMSDYALHRHPHTHTHSYRRFAPRDGGGATGGGAFPDLQNFQFNHSPEEPNALKFACETLVEELEDDIISAFSRSVTDLHLEICSRASDSCSEQHNHQEL